MPLLVVTGGPLDGSEYPLPRDAGQVILGSSMDAHVQILLGNVEPAHAWIAFAGDQMVIADAGSATGTFVNGEPVEGERVLQHGDQICLGSPGAKGSAKLCFVMPNAAGRAAGARGAGAAPARPAFAADRGDFLAETVVPLTTVGETDDGEELLLPVEADLGPADSPPLVAPMAPGSAAPLGGGSPFQSPPRAAAQEALPALAVDAVPRLADTPVGAPASRATVPAPPPPPPPMAPAAAAPAPPPRAPVPPPPAAAPAIAPPPAHHPATAPNAVPPLIPPPPRSEARAETPARGVAQPFPPLRPAAAKGGGGRRSARRRSLLPSLPVLPLAGAVLLVVIGVLAWRLIPRGTSTTTEAPAVRPEPAANAGAPAAQPSGVEPDVAVPGQTILVRGTGLADPGVSVTIAGKTAGSLQPVPGGLRVVVPPLELPEGASTTVTVHAVNRPSRTFELMIGRLPLLLGLQPLRARAGDPVTIRGRGFDAQPRGNAVTFGTQPALVLKATRDRLEVVVPAAAPTDTPEMPVAVTVAGRASGTPLSFQMTRDVGGRFVPRFFPDAVSEFPRDELAFVSSELGPLLLLGDADGLESVSARAVSVAAALNSVVAAADTTAPVIEVREGPVPAIAVAGQPKPFVRATARDAAAYSRAWESGRPARRTTASAVARHWAALLQDYLGLFLARQRPMRMLALSSRGRVLAELYAEANRRAPGEASVPGSVAFGASAAVLGSLRQLALVVAGEAPRPAVVVEGRWYGSFEDPDQGPRAFEAELRAGKAGLTGTLTTTAGSIQVRSQLRELSFERGALRFTAELQGAPYRFKGTLAGSQLSGTIERPGKPPLPFTMQFVE